MLLSISGNQFSAKFDYERRPPEPDYETDDFDYHDYREDALKERFGDKPIVYPPLDFEEEARRAAAADGGTFEF